MKKSIITFITIFFCIFFLGSIVDAALARGGCCSHHGGVCGCRCCDGTPLSSKCAPYYPSCKPKVSPKVDTPKVETPKTENPKTETIDLTPKKVVGVKGCGR